MKVKITNGTLIKGKDARPGAVVDVDISTARALFMAGKAVPAADVKEEIITRAEATQPTREKKKK